MRFGAHMSIAGGVWKALERAASIGCEVVQIFLKNNMQWFGRPYSQSELTAYANFLAAHPFHAVFAHSGYLINLAAPPSPNRDKSIKSLLQELRLAESLGLPFVVLHPGSHLGKGEEVGLEWTVRALDEIFEASRHCPVRIALENTAGQGTALGYRLEHLAEIFQRCRFPHRLALCLDTAHFFAAGYPIHQPQGWEETLQQVDRWIGLDQVVAWHLNDSKTPLGSRVDRHESIGKGAIGLEGFRHIVKDPRFTDTPGCLETPKFNNLEEDARNLATLHRLVKEE